MLSPEVYVAAIKKLRPDIHYNDIDFSKEGSFKKLLSCRGLDFQAGELVGDAIRAGLAEWQVVEVYRELVEELAEDHEDEDASAQVRLLLGMIRVARDHDTCATVGALEAIVDRVQDLASESPLIALALEVVYAALHTMARGDGRDGISRMDLSTRAFVRLVYELGGIRAVRRVLESLSSKLASMSSSQSGVSP